MTSPMDEALAAPAVALVEAKRVYGPDARVEYGSRWATAGVAMDERTQVDADEITVWSDKPLAILIACLRGMPTKGEP